MKRVIAAVSFVSLGIVAIVSCAGSPESPEVAILGTRPEEDFGDAGEAVEFPAPASPENEDASGGKNPGSLDGSTEASTSDEAGTIGTIGTVDPTDGGTSDEGGTIAPGYTERGVDAGTTSAAAGTSTDAGSTTPVDTSSTCGTTSTCTVDNSFDLGQVAGDSGSDIKLAQGSASHWIKVRVREASMWGDPLRLRATLTSPPGSNYDLFVHVWSCGTPDGKSTNTTGPDVAKVAWPDAILGGSVSDSRTVLIEVRHVSGPCAASAKWQLKVEGNR